MIEPSLESGYPLLETLHHTFGFPAFRPFQREIIEASLGGKDVFALLPTGGGKSLCFQLPSLLRKGLTVVVSPLIALMKDQVDQLQAAGVPATFLNSSLNEAETRLRLAGLHRGEWRLLYVAPERLMTDGCLENLNKWKVSAIAIDEAHCVSEWGHDFRPEYRQLSRIREYLPDVSLLALTATATERVRADIVRHLRLRAPDIFIASFNRPNLTYRVSPKNEAIRQIVDFAEKRKQESGIVYCASRATTERVADSLTRKGFAARPYHAGLSAADRSRNQELFMRDEVKIMCATIAFGMGIDKPNVRWVIHHDLPKNIEGYYQETGRAGRDGLPSDCLLLFSSGDAAKQTHFIEEMSDELERNIARSQLRQMLHYAEGAACRRRGLLEYFNEEVSGDNCGGCDNCLEPRESYDGTVIAQKFLSSIFRINLAGSHGVGLNHIVEILTGAKTEKIRRSGHDKLSTYGIGSELPRPQWAAVGRELIRLGYINQSGGEFPILVLTETGKETLLSRRPITLMRPMEISKTSRPIRREGEVDCDDALFNRLRTLRKKIADERGVPAYVIFGDKTLRHLAREYPIRIEKMNGIFGIGEIKRAEFGAVFAAEIADYLESHPRQSFD
ncbi:ATP-dependent DNA helicase [Dehalogenimonas sp. WBC-2]|nr:ATP-dependent DNA helicase [Dehalogenimonas sp. WBC-2]